MRIWCLFWRVLLLLVPAGVQAQQVLLNAPLSLQTPGYRGVLVSWHDGEEFWVPAGQLVKTLGYDMQQADSMKVLARDANRVILFDARSRTLSVNQEILLSDMPVFRGTGGEMLVSMDALQTAFGTDMNWDEGRLTLRLSSRATLFDPHQFGERARLGTEPPPQVLFPRRFRGFGGAQVKYNLTHARNEEGQSRLGASLRMTASLAGGVVRAGLSRTRPSASYTYMAARPWLTQMQIFWAQGQHSPRLHVSNAPLHPRRFFSDRIIQGETVPHAIVRAGIAGSQTEQVQADRTGRYAVRVPVFYGTSTARIQIKPLGEAPEEERTETDYLPQSLLRPGIAEYSLYGDSRSAAADLAIGVSPAITLRGSGSTGPLRAEAGATLRVSHTMYMEADANVLEQTGSMTARYWNPAGQGMMSWYRGKENRHTIHLSGQVRTEQLSLGVSLSHRRAPRAAPATEVSPALSWYGGGGIGASLHMRWFAGRPDLLRYRPDLFWSRSLRGIPVRIGAGMEGGQEGILGTRASLSLSIGKFSATAEGTRNMQTGSIRASLRMYWQTDWTWAGTTAQIRKGKTSLRSRLRGTVGVDREGITLTSEFHEKAQAILRVFEDVNLDGKRNRGEPLRDEVTVHLAGAATKRRGDGSLFASSLEELRTYTVEISSTSITDPRLVPATGYTFAFVAEPGHTRRIDIPLQKLPLVQGRIQGWQGPYQVLKVIVEGRGIVRELDVFADGTFYMQVPIGVYKIIVMDLTRPDTPIQEEVYEIGAETQELDITIWNP